MSLISSATGLEPGHARNITECWAQMSSGFCGADMRVQRAESRQKLALGINWLCRALWAPSGTASPRSPGNPGTVNYGCAVPG